MKMLKFELSKLCNFKVLIIAVILFTSVLVFSIYRSNHYNRMHDSINSANVEFLNMNLETQYSLLEIFTDEEDIAKIEKSIDYIEEKIIAIENKDYTLYAQIDYETLTRTDNTVKMDNHTVRRLNFLEYLLENDVSARRDIVNNYQTYTYAQYFDGVGSITNLFTDYLFYILPLVTILLASGIISSEKNSGSMKLLIMVKPSRISILTAKFFSSIIMSLGILMLLILAAFIGGSVIMGTGQIDYPAYIVNTSGTESIVPTYYLWLRELIIMVLSVCFYSSVVLLISSLINNSVISLLASGLVCIGSPYLSRLLYTMFKEDGYSFIPFNLADVYTTAVGVLEVNTYDNQNSAFLGISDVYTSYMVNPFTLGQAIFILAFSSLVIFGVNLLYFSKKDVG